MAEGRHEVPEAGRAAAEDAGGRRGPVDDVVDGVGRAAQPQQPVLRRAELLEGRAHPQDPLLPRLVSEGDCKDGWMNS